VFSIQLFSNAESNKIKLNKSALNKILFLFRRRGFPPTHHRSYPVGLRPEGWVREFGRNVRNGTDFAQSLPRAHPARRTSRHARSAQGAERDDQEVCREVSARREFEKLTQNINQN
jgi:hypothetical protein